jgi:hypothetical protein
MGGPHYGSDVSPERNSSTEQHFNYQGHYGANPTRREAHEDLSIKGTKGGKKRECCDSDGHPNVTAIVVAMDVTRSRGDDAKIIFQKLPMLMGQIYMKNYVPDPTISFAAIGDATCDEAPVQVGQFESDNRLDAVLGKIWLEEGGGGTGQESYELTAYYYARHSKLDCNQRGQKGYFFFVGDEGFYPQVSKDQVKAFIGDKLDEDIQTAKIFAELQEKYHTFFIYPRKSWQQRKTDIDAEIKKRVESAGGQYQNVDIRISLLWNNRNDLDLHVITPRGEHIFYGNKQSATCKGWLDVDANVHGETPKPVENTRWKIGEAPKGKYKVYVQNFRFHESSQEATPFKLEVAINGKIQHFSNETKANAYGPNSDVHVITFDYDPDQAHIEKSLEAVYSNYDDTKIKNQWASVIPRENILIIDDPKAIVDVLMGALAITAGNDLNQYLIDMGERGQTEKRIGETLGSLSELAASRNIAKVDIGSLPKDAGKKRQTKTKRL